jgi:hypothetical protein
MTTEAAEDMRTETNAATITPVATTEDTQARMASATTEGFLPTLAVVATEDAAAAATADPAEEDTAAATVTDVAATATTAT